MTFVGSTQNGDITAGVLVDINDTTVTSVSSASVGAGGALPSRAIVPNRRASLREAFGRAQRGERVATVLAGLPVNMSMHGPDVIAIDDDEPAPAAANGQENASSRSRLFRRQAEEWVISEEHVRVNQASAASSQSLERVTHWDNVRVHRNRARDAARRRLRPTTDWIPLPQPAGSSASNTSSSARLSPSTPRRYVACGDECMGGTTPSYPAPIGNAPACTMNVEANINPTGDVNLLYQHGIWSNGLTWCAGSAYQRLHFTVRNELRFTTSSAQTYELQAEQLEDSLTKYAGPFPGPYILIGHSNGGLIARNVAQDLAGTPDLIRGVISVSSPHAGAPLANLSPMQLAGVLGVPIVLFSDCDLVPTMMCNGVRWMVDHGEAAALVVALAPGLAHRDNPVLNEMVPGSQYQATLNSRGNPVQMAGIQDRAWDRWTPFRLMGDSKGCGNGVIDCGDRGGRSWVQTTDESYHRFLKCAVVSGLLGIVWRRAMSSAKLCATSAAALRSIDMQYRAVSVGNAHGDGIVPEWSQYFPGTDANSNYLADDSDSHLGETSSGRYTGAQIQSALVKTFRVPVTR